MRKSTLSHTTVFLLQVMRFAKLNKPPLSFKPPLSIKPPPQKCLKKISPPRGLNRGFTVHWNGEPNCAPHLHCKEYNIKWVEFSSRLLILIIILFTWLLTWYNVSLDWHATQQFVWWQLIIKIPAPEADKFSEWITKEGVGGGGDLHIILDRKDTPFVGLLNGTPFTYLVQNFASLFTAVNALLQIWTNHKTRVFSQLFHSQKMHLLAPCGLFTDWNDRFPFPFIYFN